MSALVVTPFTPTLESGRARRTYGTVRALAAHGTVTLVYARFGAAEPDPAYAAVPGVSLVAVTPSRGARRAASYARARAAGVPDGFARGVSPELAGRTRALAATHDRVIADGPIAAAALAPLARKHPTVYSAQNLESGFRHLIGDDQSLGSQSSLERFERRLLEAFAESWMVSRADLEGAAALAPGARLRLVPNVVDVAAIEPLPPRTGQRHAVFVGDLRYPPNRGALRFLLDDVMPAVWRIAPDVRLTVAGRGWDEVRSPDERAVLAGFVPDLRALYAEAGCVLVPLLQGGGSPLKFVEALAHGLPIVATPRAAAGLEVRPGEHFFLAEPDGEAFAGALLEALDPERAVRVAAAGRALAEREYSVEALAARLAP